MNFHVAEIKLLKATVHYTKIYFRQFNSNSKPGQCLSRPRPSSLQPSSAELSSVQFCSVVASSSSLCSISMIKCFLCSRRRSSHGTKNILKKMLKIAKMGFLLFCGLRCHCSASSSGAASALLHFSLARAAVKCSKKCQAKIVYYIFRPCTQRHTVENLCPTLNGMQAKALSNSQPSLTRAWRSVAAAKGSLAKLWHIFYPFPTFHLRTANRRWH